LAIVFTTDEAVTDATPNFASYKVGWIAYTADAQVPTTGANTLLFFAASSLTKLILSF